MKDFRFRIDLKPLSVNEAWKGRRYATEKYKRYQRSALLLMPLKRLKTSDMMRIDLTFGFSSKLADIDNPVKMILDILQKKYGFNDRDVFELNISKKIVAKGKEYTDITIGNYLPFD